MVTNYTDKNKILIISHAADVDGMGSIILGKVHFGDIDYCLAEYSELDDALEELINSGRYKQYDEIFITDLSIRSKGLELIDSNEEFKRKVRHFDHHPSETYNNGKYSFVNVVVDDEKGVPVCGTTLFYDYIKDDFKYDSEFLDKFLEGVRSHDTLGPVLSVPYGRDLTALFGLIGRDAFIEKYVEGIKEKKDPFTKSDRMIVDAEYKRISDYVDECDKRLIRMNLGDHRVGVSISELYRSSVGNELSAKYKDELDYILIVNFMRNQFSFRTVRDDVNVAEIAKGFQKDGGGHPKAAGCQMCPENKFILDAILQEMLGNNTKLEKKPE